MNLSHKNISGKLSEHNIRPSFQRIKVLEYLMQNQCHPSAEQIFNELQSVIPTLSKTTIYNTLNRLADVGLVKVLNIEDNEARYDIITENHGHFRCVECGTIYNFEVDVDTVDAKELNGFITTDRNVYFKGICQKCLLNINYNKRKEYVS